MLTFIVVGQFAVLFFLVFLSELISGGSFGYIVLGVFGISAVLLYINRAKKH